MIKKSIYLKMLNRTQPLMNLKKWLIKLKNIFLEGEIFQVVLSRTFKKKLTQDLLQFIDL